MARQGGAVSFAACVLALVACAAGQGSRESTVGVPATIEELVLPGTELAAAPVDAKSPIVVRVLSASPHGTAYRYDLEFTGLEPGDHDLKDFLRRKDGTGSSDLPPIPVTIRSLLPAGRVTPHAPRGGDPTSLGGYRTALVAGGILWIAGLAVLLFARKKRPGSVEVGAPQPKTLAERLRPLVERAIDGRLSREDRARLELSLLAYWRKELGLEDRRPEEVIAAMRAHARAGPLLESLEVWLHRPPRTPGARGGAEIDLASLLAPYRDLPPDAIDVPSARGG
jgi:hypothetical protein